MTDTQSSEPKQDPLVEAMVAAMWPGQVLHPAIVGAQTKWAAEIVKRLEADGWVIGRKERLLGGVP